MSKYYTGVALIVLGTVAFSVWAVREVNACLDSKGSIVHSKMKISCEK